MAKHVSKQVDGFCVSNLDEALELRQAGIEQPILILGVVLPDGVPLAIQENISLTVASLEWLALAQKQGLDLTGLTCHIKVDSGMEMCIRDRGGIVLHYGDVAEMRTGEGKTLTATMPVYLNAISGEGVHVITVNEYLSERDATEMGELYSWLGLSVGINLSSKSPAEKREAYNCDITYSTSSEVDVYKRQAKRTSSV